MSSVINMFDREPKKKNEEQEEEVKEYSFEEIMRRNAENAERLKKERSKANKNVTRSYRLKK